MVSEEKQMSAKYQKTVRFQSPRKAPEIKANDLEPEDSANLDITNVSTKVKAPEFIVEA